MSHTPIKYERPQEQPKQPSKTPAEYRDEEIESRQQNRRQELYDIIARHHPDTKEQRGAHETYRILAEYALTGRNVPRFFLKLTEAGIEPEQADLEKVRKFCDDHGYKFPGCLYNTKEIREMARRNRIRIISAHPEDLSSANAVIVTNDGKFFHAKIDPAKKEMVLVEYGE